MRNRRQQLFASKLAIQVQLKVLYLEVSVRTSSLQQYSYMMPKTINIGQRCDTTHTTEAPPTINFPSSRNFWCFSMVSSPLSHIRLFSLAFFCSTSTQTVLTHTVGSNRVQRSAVTEYKGHLQLKHSTTERCVKTTLLCPTYSLKAAKLIHGDMTTI